MPTSSHGKKKSALKTADLIKDLNETANPETFIPKQQPSKNLQSTDAMLWDEEERLDMKPMHFKDPPKSLKGAVQAAPAMEWEDEQTESSNGNLFGVSQYIPTISLQEAQKSNQYKSIPASFPMTKMTESDEEEIETTDFTQDYSPKVNEKREHEIQIKSQQKPVEASNLNVKSDFSTINANPKEKTRNDAGKKKNFSSQNDKNSEKLSASHVKFNMPSRPAPAPPNSNPSSPKLPSIPAISKEASLRSSSNVDSSNKAATPKSYTYPLRGWTDDTGTYKVNARFLSATMKKDKSKEKPFIAIFLSQESTENGGKENKFMIPLEKLSLDDKEYLESVIPLSEWKKWHRTLAEYKESKLGEQVVSESKEPIMEDVLVRKNRAKIANTKNKTKEDLELEESLKSLLDSLKTASLRKDSEVKHTEKISQDNIKSSQFQNLGSSVASLAPKVPDGNIQTTATGINSYGSQANNPESYRKSSVPSLTPQKPQNSLSNDDINYLLSSVNKNLSHQSASLNSHGHSQQGQYYSSTMSVAPIRPQQAPIRPMQHTQQAQPIQPYYLNQSKDNFNANMRPYSGNTYSGQSTNLPNSSSIGYSSNTAVQYQAATSIPPQRRMSLPTTQPVTLNRVNSMMPTNAAYATPSYQNGALPSLNAHDNNMIAPLVPRTQFIPNTLNNNLQQPGRMNMGATSMNQQSLQYPAMHQQQFHQQPLGLPPTTSYAQNTMQSKNFPNGQNQNSGQTRAAQSVQSMSSTNPSQSNYFQAQSNYFPPGSMHYNSTMR